MLHQMKYLPGVQAGLSAAERRHLGRQQNRLSRSIYREKHDAQAR